ncbi:M48 family metallopeptidase [Vibrio sp.]|nr:M48 family metallopeptidase [Vibrio sp.]
MPANLSVLNGYPDSIQHNIKHAIESETFIPWFKSKYPNNHKITTDKALYQYTQELKSRFLKKSSPLKNVVYDKKIQPIQHALGLHSYITKSHGGKTKVRNEIRIASVFQHAPEALLKMIVVHELAHIKEKEHNKAFYSLCQHMEPDYHQLEFEARLFLIYNELCQR